MGRSFFYLNVLYKNLQVRIELISIITRAKIIIFVLLIHFKVPLSFANFYSTHYKFQKYFTTHFIAMCTPYLFNSVRRSTFDAGLVTNLVLFQYNIYSI